MRMRTTAAAVILAAATSIPMAGLAYAQDYSYAPAQSGDNGGDNADDNAGDNAGDNSGDNASDDAGFTDDENGDNGDNGDNGNGDNGNGDNNGGGGGGGGGPQVPTPPVGGVETGDGSGSNEMLPGLLVLGGLTTLSAGAGAVALRRNARKSN